MIKLVIDYENKNKKLLIATYDGKATKLNELNLLRLVFINIFQNFKVTLGIHYEALKLWFKGATYNKKPNKPKKFSTKI